MSRQWLWRLAAQAPVVVWAVCLLAPVGYGAIAVNQSVRVDTQGMRAQVERLEGEVRGMLGQLRSLRSRQGGGGGSGGRASEEMLELSLRYECGIYKDFHIAAAQEKLVLTFNGKSLAALCVLRAIGEFPGGVQQMARAADDKVMFIWEGAQA